ncbi:MAG: carboxypeptidase regulatory-like domain-containing protein, partial [Candidatus Eremiobacteraeota bacterium]|nr:carboxypeptidase regulatory-like domain-containing protein [Candidatus Eremiobacteraeota bacterium]
MTRFRLSILIFAVFVLSMPTAALAAGTVFLSGTVTADGIAVADATVLASGNNATFRTTTNARGEFSFPSLLAGTYLLNASGRGGTASASVDLTGSGVTVNLPLQPR